MGKVTVLIADDHSLIRRGRMEVLAEEDGIVVVGEAADGVEAVRKAMAVASDVGSAWRRRLFPSTEVLTIGVGR